MNNRVKDKYNTYRLIYHKNVSSFTRLAIPLMILITHVAFLYGQIQTMWYLYFQINFEGDIKATTWDSKLFFQTVGLKNPTSLNTTHTQRLDEFTYCKSI